MIQTWLWIAVMGHLFNATAFIIDKTLLATAFKHSSTYAALIGLLSGILIFATPWITHWPQLHTLLFVALFGIAQVLALWAFFTALSRGEASRVVPIVGVLVALITLIGTRITLGETLEPRRIMGFAVLVLATAVLAWGGKVKDRLAPIALGSAVFAAFLFAVSTVSGKIAFQQEGFFGVFVLSRYFTVSTALLLLLLYKPGRIELGQLFFPKRSKKIVSKKAVSLTIVAQVSGAIGFIFVNYAISLGSAPLVQALQSVQYGAIVLLAWFGGKKLQHILKEQRTPLIVALKSFAILLVGTGLYLVSHL